MYALRVVNQVATVLCKRMGNIHMKLGIPTRATYDEHAHAIRALRSGEVLGVSGRNNGTLLGNALVQPLSQSGHSQLLLLILFCFVAYYCAF